MLDRATVITVNLDDSSLWEDLSEDDALHYFSVFLNTSWQSFYPGMRSLYFAVFSCSFLHEILHNC